MGVCEPLWVSVVTLKSTTETKSRYSSTHLKDDVHLCQELLKGRMVSVTDFQLTSELGNNNVKTSASTSKGFQVPLYHRPLAPGVVFPQVSNGAKQTGFAVFAG